MTHPTAWGRPYDVDRLRIYRAEPAAAKRARDWAGECALSFGRPDIADRVREVASELATNALRHGVRPGRPEYEGFFAVRPWAHRGTYLLDVIDRHPARKPVKRCDTTLRVGGLGLVIVDEMATEWLYFTRRVGRRDAVKVVRAAFGPPGSEKGCTSMAITRGRAPSGWVRSPGETSGVPLWQWRGEPVYAATRDMDQLLFIGAALARFDRMSAEEFHDFLAAAEAAPGEPYGPA